MSYYLGISRLDAAGTKRNAYFSDLSRVQYEQIQAWIVDLDFFKQNRNLAWVISADRDGITHILDAAFKEAVSSPERFDNGSPRSERLSLEVNRGFLSYLSAARTYLDYTELNLKRRFGEESTQVSRFKKVSSQQYDSQFAYRLFAKLRNYAQHCGFPVGAGFHMESNGDGKTISVTLQVRFDRDRLLLERKVWGALLRSELEAKTGPIEAVPELLVHHDCMMKIAREVELACSSALHAAKDGLNQVIKDNGEEGGVFAIHKELKRSTVPEGGETTTLTDERFPMNVFSVIDTDIPR